MAKDFTDTDFFNAALTRESDLAHLKLSKSCAIFSLYCAGVIIECILRAFMDKNGVPYDTKHDLVKMFKNSKMVNSLDVYDVNSREKLSSAIVVASKNWNIDLRYTSELRMRRKLGREIARKKIKSSDINDYLLKSKKDLFKSAETFLKITKQIWN